MKSLNQSLFPSIDLPNPVQKERHSSSGIVPSLLKWTGSKRSQAAQIAALIPAHKRYHEPFLGGGALLYLMASKGSIGSDVYKPLVDFWLLVRDQPHELISDYQDQWNRLQADLPGYFYEVRSKFNLEKKATDLNFLMRTCVNGIVRFSAAGDFNNSFHLSRKGMIPATFARSVWLWNSRVQGVDFRVSDYRESLRRAQDGDFVYLDPPYAGNKQRYIGDVSQTELCAELDALNSRNVKWALSFDGSRGDLEYASEIPKNIYRQKLNLSSGYSAVSKVLNGPVEEVTEALYLNF